MKISNGLDNSYTIIGGLKNKELITPLSFQGTTDRSIFLFWLEECLGKEIKEGDVIIMADASIHKSMEVKELIESRGAKLIYQPPHSPFLNKIEHHWAFMKKMPKA